jgi:hypothetical protein
VPVEFEFVSFIIHYSSGVPRGLILQCAVWIYDVKKYMNMLDYFNKNMFSFHLI